MADATDGAGTARRRGGKAAFAAGLIAILIVVSRPAVACAASGPGEGDPAVRQPGAGSSPEDDGSYRTPLAGEPFHTMFLGRTVDIPRRDRGNQRAVTLGGALYLPDLGDIPGYPIFNFYLKRTWEDARLRVMASGFVNDVSAARRDGALELVGSLETNTIPVGQKEIRDGRAVAGSTVEWGTVSAYFGAGVLVPVAPYQVDNNLRLQLLARVGYLYSRPTGDTDPGVRLPPDTVLYGGRLRGRYDGFRRNLLELPHRGVAAGFDLDFVRRADWSDYGNGVMTFPEGDGREYVKGAAYLMGAGGIPGLSEKNRFLVALHVGLADTKRIDRYNAFWLGGGPFFSETDELYHPNVPAALFNTTIASSYVVSNVEYRRELLFFLYLHLRGTFTWADRAVVIAGNQVGFRDAVGETGSVGLTSGLFWNSQVYVQYAWDSGLLRDGESGSSVQMLFSKSF